MAGISQLGNTSIFFYSSNGIGYDFRPKDFDSAAAISPGPRRMVQLGLVLIHALCVLRQHYRRFYVFDTIHYTAGLVI